MNVDLYLRKLTQAHEQTNALRKRAEQLLAEAPADLPRAQAELLSDLLNQLSLSMEELQVAEEELHQPASELQLVNQDLEAERRRYQELTVEIHGSPGEGTTVVIDVPLAEANHS